METKYFIICPRCGKITNNINEYRFYETITRSDKIIDLNNEELIEETVEESGTYHRECDEYLSNIFVKDITIIIKDGEIKYIGDYYKNKNPKELFGKILAEVV